MRVLLLLLIAGGLTTLPFVWLKQPWAVQLWRRVRVVLVIYALVILLAAIVRLVFNWDAIYG
jgi:hypothetical protein